MACTEGDSFTVDSDVTYENSLSFSGCYEARAEPWGIYDGTAYFLDGEEVGGTPGVFPSEYLDDEHGVWALGYYTTDGTFTRRCKDADEEDTSTLHPTDILQWDCKEDDDPDETSLYPDEDAAVTITCGCDSPTTSPTPSPTPFLTFSPTSPSPTSPSPTTPSPPSSTPVGAIAGGAVVGVVVVGSAILAILFRTGRFKDCRGGSRSTPAHDGVSPGSAIGSVPNGGTSVGATTGPTARQFPIAHQYPAAV
ncbi:unnamed protein product [Ectocarpus sp. 4 AP-2014]